MQSWGAPYIGFATAAALLIVCFPSPVSAQPKDRVSPDVSDLSRNLDDSEASFRYARKAIAAGDVRGAISALERVLQINPNLANIKLELGLLYLRVGQSDLARSYLEAAAVAADAPRDARDRARRALRLADQQLSKWTIGGTVSLSAQAQSNPNGSPGSVSVRGPFGAPIIVSGDDLSIRRKTDLSGVAALNVEVAYGVGDQQGNEIVFDLTAVENEYDQTSELDATFLSARLGPRIYFGNPLNPAGYIRPFASGTYLALDRDTYFKAYGGGAVGSFQPGIGWTITGVAAYEHRDFSPTVLRPRSDDQTGDYGSGVLDIAVQVDPRIRLNVGFVIEHVAARADYWSRLTYGPQIGAILALRSLTGGDPWVARLGAGYRRSDYDQADPFVDPDVLRTENRYDIDATLSIPISQNFSLDIRAQQTWNKSSLPNYRFENTLGSFGISYRF